MRFLLLMCLSWVMVSCATKRNLSVHDTATGDESLLVMEIIATSDEVSESELEDVLNILDELSQNPILVNSASFDDFMRIPAMRPAYARALIRQRDRLGRFTNRTQLRTVPGIPRDVIARIEPYLTLGSTAELLRTTVFAPSYWAAGARIESLTRLRGTLETMDGYRGDLPNKERVYEGPPIERYQRIAIQSRHLRFGTHFRAAPGAVGYTSDQVFKASFIGLTDLPVFEHFVAGRYNVAYGMGLSMGGGRIPRRGFDMALPRGGTRTVSPYAGSSYSQGHRGVAIRFGRELSTALWMSSRGYTGSDADSSGVRWSASEPLFRTVAERGRRDNFSVRLAGFRSDWRRSTYQVGVAGWMAFASETVKPPQSQYLEVGVQGDRFGMLSADIRARSHLGSYGAEVAVDAGGSYGVVGGGEMSVVEGVELSMLGRYIEAGFQSPFGVSVGTWSGRPSNERGLYVGVSYGPNRVTRFTAYSDQYASLLPRSSRFLPVRGHDMGIRILRGGGIASVQATLQHRLRDDETEGEDVYGRIYRRRYTSSRSTARVDLTTSLLPRATWVTRAEWVWAGQDDNMIDRGYLIHQDLSWWMLSSLRLQARVTIFNSDSHESRLYGWEPDVRLASSMPSFSGQGSRQYILVTYKPNPKLEARVKLARTHMPYQYTIGSGNDTIRGSQRTQIHSSILLRT